MDTDGRGPRRRNEHERDFSDAVFSSATRLPQGGARPDELRAVWDTAAVRRWHSRADCGIFEGMNTNTEMIWSMDPESLMRQAIEVAREGIARGRARLAVRLLVPANCWPVATTRYWRHPTHGPRGNQRPAHGLPGGQSVHLQGAIVATTCEPCPMCMAALHWAQVEHVYFGATIDDAQQAGFNELQLPASDLLRLGKSSVQLVPGVLRDECRALFQEWLDRPEHTSY